MAENKQNFADSIEVKGGTHTADFIERLEKMGIPGMGANPMFQIPTMGMGGMNPATNGLFGAGTMAKIMSGENSDALDKLMILKTMAEHLEKESVGVELECAHDVSNSIYDAISKISSSKKS